MSQLNWTNRTLVLCPNVNGTVAYTIESFLLLALASASTALHYIFMTVLCKTSGQLPLNTKLLMINCTTAGLLKSLCMIGKALYNLCLSTFGFSELAMSRVACVLGEIPYGISITSLVVSMVFIGCERMWTTFTLKNKNQNETVGCGIIAAQVTIWIVSVGMYACLMLMDADTVATTSCYCYYSIVYSALSSTVNKVFLIGAQTFIVIIYMAVMWQNRRNLFEFTMNTARHSLVERFVMWANVKTTRMLLPPAVVHAFTYDIIILALYLLREAFKGGVSDAYVTALVATQCAICLDTMIQPLFCILISRELRSLMLKMYPKIANFVKRRNTVSAAETVDKKEQKGGGKRECLQVVQQTNSVKQYHLNSQQHLEMLENIWEKEAKHINLVPQRSIKLKQKV